MKTPMVVCISCTQTPTAEGSIICKSCKKEAENIVLEIQPFYGGFSCDI